MLGGEAGRWIVHAGGTRAKDGWSAPRGSRPRTPWARHRGRRGAAGRARGRAAGGTAKEAHLTRAGAGSNFADFLRQVANLSPGCQTHNTRTQSTHRDKRHYPNGQRRPVLPPAINATCCEGLLSAAINRPATVKV